MIGESATVRARPASHSFKARRPATVTPRHTCARPSHPSNPRTALLSTRYAMALRLHIARRMTKAALVFALLAVPLAAWAQPPVSATDPPDGAIVSSAQVSGFDL